VSPVRVVAAVIWRDERVLLTQRPPGGRHELLWELPGGKIEPGESTERAVTRELAEELGVRATPFETLGTFRYAYPEGPDVEIVFVRCTLASTDFRCSDAVHAVRWVRPADIDMREVLAGDHEFLRGLGAREGA
jgi:8-oxo-dGTP diphosphatase